eukprot:m.294121 g.294121  ORF g.294121 m.294121 type:complete len:65 (-) comp15847_c0_seq2:476-670(-)
MFTAISVKPWSILAPTRLLNLLPWKQLKHQLLSFGHVTRNAEHAMCGFRPLPKCSEQCKMLQAF